MPRRQHHDAILSSEPRTDGEPRRAVTSVNLRYEDKVRFDLLQAYWSHVRGRPIKQWDAFSLLLAAAVQNPHADVPEELRGSNGRLR